MIEKRNERELERRETIEGRGEGMVEERRERGKRDG